MFPNNLDKISITKNFVGRREELDNLSLILRRMATRANDSFDLCTIIGIGGQGKVSAKSWITLYLHVYLYVKDSKIILHI